MITIEAPPGSYRLQLPDSTTGENGADTLSSPNSIVILPSDAMIDWMADNNVSCKIVGSWETHDLHFNLAADIHFDCADDAIIFKLTWPLS